ncbi:MAG TPA: cytochrome c-type biogenesis protein CcmH [Solirubrobacteraceae bacterium]|nr:cytochrome c-type biogenesis protein CcmH [Solirubrobacteraceae bacterium]
MRRIAVTLVLLSALVSAGPALAGGYQNLMSIESQFICTSCHEPLELVSSPQALSEKAYLEGLVQKNMSISQIKAAMVSQYGVAVLAKPPANGFNLTVYILPPAILLGGLALLAYTLPRWRRRARAMAPLDHAGPLSSADQSRLNDELDRFL